VYRFNTTNKIKCQVQNMEGSINGIGKPSLLYILNVHDT